MASAQQQKFTAGVQRALALRQRERVTADDASEAWAALRQGVVAARRCEGVLDSLPREEALVCPVLRAPFPGRQQPPSKFLGTLASELSKENVRKELGRAQECLRILLAQPSWLELALTEARPEVLAAMDRERDAALLAPLVAAQAAEEKAAEEPEGYASEATISVAADEEGGADAEGGGSSCGEPEEEPVDPSQKLRRSILEKLAGARESLASLDWRFPVDITGLRGDEAVRGFTLLHDALTMMSTGSGRAAVGGSELDALALHFEEGDWAPLLDFLLGLYGTPSRRSYCSRARYVVLRLRALVPAFREAMPWAKLPWGKEPVPEAELAEERRLRAAEEAEGLLLATELQLQEEREAEEQRERQEQLALEDEELARQLQQELQEELQEEEPQQPEAPLSQSLQVQRGAVQERREKLAASGKQTPRGSGSRLSVMAPKLLRRRAAGA